MESFTDQGYVLIIELLLCYSGIFFPVEVLETEGERALNKSIPVYSSYCCRAQGLFQLNFVFTEVTSQEIPVVYTSPNANIHKKGILQAFVCTSGW